MEFWGMIAVNAVTGGICILIGFLIKRFKASRFIAGYNALNQKQREAQSEEERVNAAARLCYSLGLCLIVGAAAALVISRYATAIFCVSWIVFAGLLVLNEIRVNADTRRKADK
jgi:hypothetical protein